MTVKGTVTSFSIYRLFNAEIKSKKTKTNTLTDSLGRFEIMVPLDDMLTFNARGFEKNQRKVKAATDPMAGPYNSNGTYEILAVFVVNGRVTEKIDHINPLDVKSIKVLKGSDANIYHKSGSANQSYGSINVLGAILIETK